MANHAICRGCKDGCTPESAVHCVVCVLQAWPCDAVVRGDLLMGAAAEIHRGRKHGEYGSSFLDCDQAPCVRYRAALGESPAPTEALP